MIHKLYKYLIIYSMMLLISNPALLAQTKLNIDSCYAQAQRNYPLILQYELIAKSAEYSIENINKGYLPQLNIAGQATYQSEVTSLPIKIPNVNIETISKDQYKLYGEVNQPITDLFTIKSQRDLVKANRGIENQKVEVELYKLKERINNLFFGLLLINEQEKQIELLKKDIQTGIDKTTVAIANGVALKSSADNLKAELLKVDQKTIELNANKKALLAMLSLFINQPLAENTVLEVPQQKNIIKTINRPELTLFDLQKKSLDVQNSLIVAKNLPRLNLFFQGGLGRPALNFLNNDVKGYYIGGLRLFWNLNGFYTFNKEKKIVALNQDGLEIQKSIFQFNTQLGMEQQDAEISKARELIETDNNIITLRESVKNSTKTQLENGTATTNDFLVSVNAQDQARQNLVLHQIQLLMAQYNFKTISGN